jgi:hypothetical protein
MLGQSISPLLVPRIPLSIGVECVGLKYSKPENLNSAATYRRFSS